jgi:hypothetical protein
MYEAVPRITPASVWPVHRREFTARSKTMFNEPPDELKIQKEINRVVDAMARGPVG